MKEIGQAPIIVKKEVNGFVLNRLQYALLNEAWRLVEVWCGLQQARWSVNINENSSNLFDVALHRLLFTIIKVMQNFLDLFNMKFALKFHS